MIAIFLIVAQAQFGGRAWASPPGTDAVVAAEPASPAPSLQAPVPAPAQRASAPPAASPGTSPVPAPQGIAVVALSGATDAAWPLAQQIYSDPTLRAPHLDEAHARVLCGESPRADDQAPLRDLADTIAAVRGDDAPSRALLAEIARSVGVRALVVVRVDADRPVAHVFLADTGAFDAAIYQPDAGPGVLWSGAVRSLARTLGAPQTPAPALATRPLHPVPHADTRAGARPFYVSPWFWGALGLAAAAGGVAYLVARDSGSPTIHLDVEVPHQ